MLIWRVTLPPNTAIFDRNQGSLGTLRRVVIRGEHHERTKHIERRHFWIRELVENGQLVVPLVKTDDNLSDFFTKPLEPTKFISMRNHIMNYEHE